MCRIAGKVSLKDDADEKKNLVSKMCLAMQHGGPDGSGLFLGDKNSICFGHRRLALIDLTENAAQPMTDGSGNYTITFNGEIYNYQILKAELQKLGYQFKNQSDTEVILIAYEHWGTAAFARFNGMFAFALFDKKLQKVFLARDQSGMKPLYYQIKNGELIFASEIRAFRKIDFCEENPDWKTMFLAFGFIPEPATILKNVLMLPKASFLEWNVPAAEHQLQNYENEKFLENINDQQVAEKIIRQNLNLAVIRHLVADAPIGVFLSGGIDSSIIALEASKVKGNQLHTLSLTFEDRDCDESKYQDLIADKTGSRHHHVQISKKDFDENLHLFLQAIDQPSADGMNSWFVSRFAQNCGLKAVLSGLGGDELFGGYPSFSRIEMLTKLSNLPAVLLKQFQKSPSANQHKLAYLSLGSSTGYYLALRGFFAPAEIAQILNIPIKEVWETLKSINQEEIQVINNQEFISNLEKDIYMKNQLLRDTDVMGMQHGIEIRMPYLDHDFLNAVESINPNIRFDNKLSKGLLIKSYQKQLPSEIWQRKKMGFSFPLQKWLKNSSVLHNIHSRSNPFFKSIANGFSLDKIHWSKMIALYLIENKY